MNIIIQSSLKTLQKSHSILAGLSNDQLSNTSVAPYHSSIGSHIRHILDFYNCILNRDLGNKIDLTERNRNKGVETCCNSALEYLNDIIEKLQVSSNDVLDTTVIVEDDLGMGKIEMTYTLAAVYSQAHSHTIHHYAIINYILNGLDISLDDLSIGYNPTTPRNIRQKD